MYFTGANVILILYLFPNSVSVAAKLAGSNNSRADSESPRKPAEGAAALRRNQAEPQTLGAR